MFKKIGAALVGAALVLGFGAAPAHAATASYIHAGIRKSIASPAADNGCSVYLTVHSPWVSTADGQTLAECSVERGNNVVEIGWRKQPNGDPKLFSYWWKDVGGVRTPQCYDLGCGFVSSSGTSGVPASCTPGQNLASVIGQSKLFYVQHFNGVWWLAYDGQWCGYYPDSLWAGQSPAFDRADFIQAFGEVSSYTRAYPAICSDMGSNALPPSTSAARIEKAHVVGGTAANDTWTTVLQATGSSSVNTAHYDVQPFTSSTDAYPRNFRYGGPGSC